MKIKTITCHDVYNVGASLQAYALAEYLKQLGHEVEIIDYKPDYLSNHYPLFGLSNPAYDKPFLREAYQLAKLPGRIKARHSRRKAEYDRFTEEFLPKTAKRYSSYDELKQDPPEADVYFAGSDQIWNTLFKNGKDPAFYLDFVPEGAVRASYAASFATEDIVAEWKFQVKQWLSKLDYISVRENSGVDIINGLGVDGAVQVLDPVFLLDKAHWENLITPIDKKEPYILVYDFDTSPLVESFVKKIAQEKGWKIYSVFPCKYCDKCFSWIGPRTFLSLLYDAQFVVSNSFHATAFSLIFHKQFVVFQRKEKINARMRDLLKLIGLEMQMILKNVEQPKQIDYSIVEGRISAKIAVSKAYIDKVIKGAEAR